MTARRAVSIGHLVVNVPALAVIVIAFVVARLHTGVGETLVVLIAAAGMGWLWWAFSVPRWRRWAISHGADPRELQRIGQKTGLVWPVGSFPSKTEIRPRK